MRPPERISPRIAAPTAPVRMARHRKKILYLKFTNKYLPGKQMPCDYAFRHAVPIEGLTKEENEWLMVDEGEDVHVMRVIMADLPPAMTMDMVKDVAEHEQCTESNKKRSYRHNDQRSN